jgi:uncharacterized RDD family membrane protein YckC
MEKMELFQKRLAAGAMDLILFGSVCMFLHVPLYWLNGMIFGGSAVILSFSSAILFLFFAFLIAAKDGPTWFIAPLQGQSPGKKAIGLIATKTDGRTNISWEESIKRNSPLCLPYLVAVACQFFRMVPFISGFLLIIAMLGLLVSSAIIALEVLLIYKDPEGRRWGDKLAGTTVVPFD